MKNTGAKRRIAWLVIAGLTAAMIVCGVVLMRLAAQPHWRTYQYPADPKTGIAFAIDYPDNWGLEPVAGALGAQRSGVALFLLRKQTGLAGWWAEHFLAQNSRNPFPPALTFQVMSNQPEGKLDFLETSYRKRAAGVPTLASFYIVRVNHPLGPAFEADTIYHLPTSGAQPPQRMRICFFMIAPDEPRLKRHTLIAIRYWGPEGVFPGGDARLQEILRRVHIVSTTRGTTK